MLQEWSPITDYEVAPAELADRELRALSRVWAEQRARLEEFDSVSNFMERLKREWAIETGLIERIYTLDRGITELMIEHGVNAALIPHHATNDPERTAAIIGDQKSAIESIFDFVKGNRPLSTSYIKEVHSLFTRNQEFAEGRDMFGNKNKVPLIRGDYKKLPNNPLRPDGTTHPYCPPEHTAAEMDQLIALHAAHKDEGIAPEVEAAWLHHRFVQIHPFQDGNGRVARALATLIFIKASWLPLVVRNRERGEYIRSLESADDGDLSLLISFFARLQRQQFLKALGVARDMEKSIRVDERIRSISERLAQRKVSLKHEWESAKKHAEHLHAVTKNRLDSVCFSLVDGLSDSQDFSFFVNDETDASDRSHYFMRQIISTAKDLDYYADMQHYRSWVRLVLKDGNQSNILISFHGIGHEFRGVLVCSATWFQRTPTEEGGSESGGENSLCDEVFQINYKEDLEDIKLRFKGWLDSVLERGLSLWEKSVL